MTETYTIGIREKVRSITAVLVILAMCIAGLPLLPPEAVAAEAPYETGSTGNGVSYEAVMQQSAPALPRWDFNQAGDAEGWSAAADTSPFTVTGGALHTRSSGPNPRTAYHDVMASADTIPYLIVKLKKYPVNSSGEKLKVYFTTGAEPAADESKSLALDFHRDGYWHTYSFSLADNAKWEGTIRTMRLTLGNIAGSDIAIDAIYFSPVPVEDVPPLVDVTADPEPGVVRRGSRVALASTVTGAIYYTTDGSDPRMSQTAMLYTMPIAVDADLAVKAYSIAPDSTESEVSVFNYDVVNEAWDFEHTLNGWRTGSADGKMTVALDQGKGRGGTQAMRIGQANNTLFYAASNRYKVQGDTLYTYQLYVNIPQALDGLPYYGKVGLNVVEFDSDGKTLVIDKKYEVNATNGWLPLSMTFRTKAAASEVQLRFVATGSGDAWVDDIQFRDATELESKRIRQYSGTLEEKVLLNGTDALAAERPVTINVGTDVPVGESANFNINLFWEHEGIYDPGPYRGGMLTIFPKPAKEVASVDFWLKVNGLIGQPALELRFRELGELFDYWSKTLDLSVMQQDEWAYVQIPVFEFTHRTSGMGKGSPDFNNVERLYTLLDGPAESKADISIAGLRFSLADQTRELIINPDRGDFQFEVQAQPAWPAANEDGVGKVVLGMNGKYASSDTGKQSLLDFQTWLFPNLYYMGNTHLNYLQESRNFLNAHNIGVGLQMGHSYGLNNFLTRNEAWGYNFSGESRNLTPGIGDFGQWNHGNDYLHPQYAEAFQWAIRQAAGVKMDEIQLIDHRITKMNGDLAHSETDRAVYRELLKGNDGGVVFKKLDGTVETVTFWEYFRRFNGFVYTPADLGLDSWDAYTPLTAAKVNSNAASDYDRINYYIFIHLTKYALLESTQQFGQYAVQQGIRLSIVPNGEGFDNGIDPIGLYQLADVPVVAWEFFRSPLQVKDLYMESAYIQESIALYDKNLRLVSETGHNGTGEPYYAPELAYVTHYDASLSLGAKSLENDWMDDSFSYVALDREHYPAKFARTLDLYEKGTAFNHAFADQASVNRAYQDQVVVLRRPGGNFVRTEEPYQLYNAVRALNVPAHAVKYEEFEHFSGSAKVLVNDYSAQPHDLKERLVDWIDETPGRSLVLHGFGPGTLMGGTNYSAAWGWDWSRMTAPGYYEDVLGSALVADSSKGKAGTVVSLLPQWADLLPAALAADIPGGLYTGGGQETVAALNGDPLVSRTLRPNGNYVYYLHYRPNQAVTAELERGIMSAILKEQGVALMTEQADGLVVNGYVQDNGVQIYAAYDTASLGGTPNVFPYEATGLDRSFKVRPGGLQSAWIVYDLLGDRVLQAEADASGLVALELTDVTAALFYLIPEEPGWEQELQRLQDRRTDIYKLTAGPVAVPAGPGGP